MIGAPCEPCKKDGKLRSSTKDLNGVPMCESHHFLLKARVPANQPGKLEMVSVQEEQAESQVSAPESQEDKPVSTLSETMKKHRERLESVKAKQEPAGLCSCGRPLKHRGRCRGQKLVTPSERASQVTASLPKITSRTSVRPSASRANGHTSYDAVLADMKTKRDELLEQVEKIENVIRSIEELRDNL